MKQTSKPVTRPHASVSLKACDNENMSHLHSVKRVTSIQHTARLVRCLGLPWRFSPRLLASVVAAVMSLIALMASSQAGTHVISPIVSQGEFELEAKFTRTFDKGNDEFDNAQAHALSFAYGVNSFWATEVELQWKKDADGGTRHFDSTSWENRFQLTPQGEYWADEYEGWR